MIIWFGLINYQKINDKCKNIMNPFWDSQIKACNCKLIFYQYWKYNCFISSTNSQNLFVKIVSLKEK
jgi:hypothetical protein